MTASGRSPGASGLSLARAASSRARPRAYPRARRSRSGVRPRHARAPLTTALPQRAPPVARAARARRGLGVGGLGDRAHDDDPARAARGHVADVARVQPADREPRRRQVRRRPLDVAEPGGRAARLGRRRVHRSDDDVVDVGIGVGLARPAPGACVDRPTIRSGPTAARAAATGASSCPTCTPSAPHASTRSGRSLRMNSAPARVGRGTERRARRRRCRRRRAPCRAAGSGRRLRGAPRPGTPAGGRRRRGTDGSRRCGRAGSRDQVKHAVRANLCTYGSPLSG